MTTEKDKISDSALLANILIAILVGLAARVGYGAVTDADAATLHDGMRSALHCVCGVVIATAAFWVISIFNYILSEDKKG